MLVVLGCRRAEEELPTGPSAFPPAPKDPVGWPQWRGPGSAGIASSGLGSPVRFHSNGGFRWKVEVPGEGNSSPVVWEDSVLLTAALPETNPPTLAILCFDRRDGRLLWQKEIGQAQGPTHNKNGYASATLATDGQRIVAFFGSAGLFCCDFSGNLLWHADLGKLDHQWGTASSPVIYGNLVIQLCDSETGSSITAFDKQSGKPAWRTERPSTGCWTTPVLIACGAGVSPAWAGETPAPQHDELIVNGTGGKESGGLVLAYDPRDGRELWRVRGTTDIVTPTTIAGSGLVYSTSGRNGPIIAIRPGGDGDVTDTHVAWKLNRGGPYIPTGLMVRDRLFVIFDNGQVTCYRSDDGEVVWTKRLRGDFSASLVAADDRIYAASEQGIVYVFAAADEFSLLTENDLKEPILATPAMAAGELFLRTAGHLYCIPGGGWRVAGGGREGLGIRDSGFERVNQTGLSDSQHPVPNPQSPIPLFSSPAPRPPSPAPRPATHPWPLFRGDSLATGVAQGDLPQKLDVLWTFSVKKGGFQSSAAIVDGVVYVGSLNGQFYAIDLASGQKRWEFPTALGFTATAAVRDGAVYVGDSDGRFYCLDAKSGKERWRFDTEAEINSSANFHGPNVLVGSQDGTLYCLQAASGKLVWKFHSGDQVRCFPTVVDDRCFVAGCDGRFHVINLKDGTEAVSVELDAPTGCAPAVLGNTAFVGTEDGALLAIDWREAKLLWRYEDPEHGAPFRSSAAVTPDVVVVGAQDKLLHAIDPKSGKRLWTFATRGLIDSSPVIVGRRAFVGSADGRLYAVDIKTGKEVWRYECGGEVTASPAVAAGRLVIGNQSSTLYCFGAK